MSGQTKHTPGPWKIYKGAVHPELSTGGNDNDAHIICDDFCGPNAPFNRALVAAAPELLASLQKAVSLLIAMDYEQDADGNLRPWVTQARNALLKATGGKHETHS